MLIRFENDSLEGHFLPHTVAVGGIRVAVACGSPRSPCLMMNTVPYNAIVAASNHREAHSEGKFALEAEHEERERFPSILSVRQVPDPPITKEFFLGLWVHSRGELICDHPCFCALFLTVNCEMFS